MCLKIRLQMFEETINTLEQCIDFKEYDDFNYQARRAEVGLIFQLCICFDVSR